MTTPPVETRPVLRVFISSTAIDLKDYREKVRDAVLRMENLPIAMETFSALSGQPASECMKMAAEADAVICIVAHRYGYVPPKELGGDGERSITWLEVAEAKKAGKPVFAFLVDPKTPWTELKEQDRLTSEPPEKTKEIIEAVKKLQEFKTYLGNETTRAMFTNADHLATLVTASLSGFAPTRERKASSVARVWKPLFCHALQPAQHFRGREARLKELKDWLESPVTPDRVISIVALGGTGKTALVQKALQEAKHSDKAGLFVWSFYTEPNTDAFLRAAYLYFTAEKDTPSGGLLERLQIALSADDAPHVLVLDGLERVQSEGGTHRRGEIEDLQLKRLLGGLASSGNTHALVTSRFPLVDLENLAGAGHRAIQLYDLELPVAIDVLRAWKVHGDDPALTELLKPLNVNDTYHALSVAVLGSYIGNFAEGDPKKAPDFSLAEAEEADEKAKKLHRILYQYVKALTQVERDLLARLSLFPRGIKIEYLGWIVQSSGEVAGALIGLKDRQLVMHLERLKGLGLVFSYGTGEGAMYSAHPFLREFFRSLLTVRAESVHESIRAKLAPSLETRPDTKPSDPAILDQYEFLIEQSLLAGCVQEAFDLYWYGMGTWQHLGWILGENIRGLRAMERFAPQDDFARTKSQLSPGDQGLVANQLGLFALASGDLIRAANAFVYSQRQHANVSDQPNESMDFQNLAWLNIAAGRFHSAIGHSERALSLATESENNDYIKFSLAFRAMCNLALGNVAEATSDFERATEMEGLPLYSLRGVHDAECKSLKGDRAGARKQTQANRRICRENNWNSDLCRCNTLLAWLVLPEKPAQASQHLRDARAFANRSGEVETQLRCFRAACELQLHLKDYPQAIAEAEAGILLADTCGFGKYSIELRIVYAEILLAAGDARKALQKAREALDRSEHPDCGYAWGKADGLHFCGVAHLRLGERELARQRLTAALELREKLGHGRIEETRRELERCGK